MKCKFIRATVAVTAAGLTLSACSNGSSGEWDAGEHVRGAKW